MITAAEHRSRRSLEGEGRSSLGEPWGDCGPVGTLTGDSSFWNCERISVFN